MALNRALLHLDGADEAADAAKARLQKQNDRLENLGDKMDAIHENLDETEAEISGLESTFGVFVGGWLDDYMGENFPDRFRTCIGGRPTNPFNKVVEQGGEVIKQGWLMKRGKAYGYGWKKRWVMLYPLAIFVFEDREQSKKKDSFSITAGTECWSFRSYDAPGDAVQHRGEKQNGFLVKVPPGKKGKKSAFHYLEGRTWEDTRDWIQETETIIRRINPDAEDNNEVFSNEQPLEMELIHDKLDGLMAKAEGLGDDAKKQHQLVLGVADQVDGATDRIVTQDQRLRKHINED